MSAGPIHCTLGFSTVYRNSFSDSLERSHAELDQLFCRSQAKLLQGLDSLHGVVDELLRDSEEMAASKLALGLAELSECSANLTVMVDILASVCTALAERAVIDPDDPLIYRERYFAVIDYGALYRNLESRGVSLPQQAFWSEAVSTVQSGGACAGLRLLERQLMDLQVYLDQYIRMVEALRRLPTQELAHQLHNTSLEVSALVMGLVRFLATSTYISILCGHSMLLYEQEVATPVSVAV